MTTNDYAVLIRKLDDEDSYEARVREFPDLVVYEDSYSQAYEEAIASIGEIVQDCLSEGVTLPNTIFPNDDYSGRVTLRVAKNLHHYLTQQAQNEGVSLNQYINTLLSFSTGYVQSNLDMQFSNRSDYWVASVKSGLGKNDSPRIKREIKNRIRFQQTPAQVA